LDEGVKSTRDVYSPVHPVARSKKESVQKKRGRGRGVTDLWDVSFFFREPGREKRNVPKKKGGKTGDVAAGGHGFLFSIFFLPDPAGARRGKGKGCGVKRGLASQSSFISVPVSVRPWGRRENSRKKKKGKKDAW